MGNVLAAHAQDEDPSLTQSPGRDGCSGHAATAEIKPSTYKVTQRAEIEEPLKARGQLAWHMK